MSKSEIIDRDKGWKAMVDRARALSGGVHVKVGVLASDDAGGLHEKDENGKSKPLTVAEIAAVQEWGTRDGKIPARSFIRSTFDRLQAELTRDAETLAVKTLFGDVTVEQAFNVLGLKLATEMRKTVTEGSGVPPPNAPSVQKRKEAKGRGGRWGVRTLVDTGRMIGAISWAVVRSGAQGTVRTLSKRG